MDSKFKIEKGIPISKPRAGGAQRIYPWKELEVGDSFFIPCETVLKRRSAQGAVSGASKRYGIKFTSRNVEGGVRIWRIA